MAISLEQLQSLIQGLPWQRIGGDDALNQLGTFCYSPNVLFPLRHDLRHTAVIKMLPDLSQLTHEQLLEFTRQLALQHQQLAEDKQQLDTKVQHLEVSNQQLDAKVQHLEVSNQQLDAKVQHLEACNQHLSVLTQKYEHELALFKQYKFGSKNEHLTAKQIHLWDEAVEEDIAAVDLELERLNADKMNTAAQKSEYARL